MCTAPRSILGVIIEAGCTLVLRHGPGLPSKSSHPFQQPFFTWHTDKQGATQAWGWCMGSLNCRTLVVSTVSGQVLTRHPHATFAGPRGVFSQGPPHQYRHSSRRPAFAMSSQIPDEYLPAAAKGGCMGFSRVVQLASEGFRAPSSKSRFGHVSVCKCHPQTSCRPGLRSGWHSAWWMGKGSMGLLC